MNELEEGSSLNIAGSPTVGLIFRCKMLNTKGETINVSAWRGHSLAIRPRLAAIFFDWDCQRVERTGLQRLIRRVNREKLVIRRCQELRNLFRMGRADFDVDLWSDVIQEL